MFGIRISTVRFIRLACAGTEMRTWFGAGDETVKRTLIRFVFGAFGSVEELVAALALQPHLWLFHYDV